MDESAFMHAWMVMIGSLATPAIILIAFGLMLGVVKVADAVKQVGAIVGIVIVLILILCITLGAWSSMSVWQRLALVVIGIGVWLLRRPRPRKGRRENE